MQICRKCGRQLLPNPVQDLSGIGHCSGCDVVFAYAPEGSTGDSVEMPRVPLPRAITVYDSDAPADTLTKVGGYRERWQPVRVANEFRIVRRWFQWSSIGLLVFALTMDLGFAPWLVILRNSKIPSDALPFLFLMIPASLVVWVTHKALAGVLNRTIIRAHDGVLEVTHGPIPVRRSRTTLPLASIEQIYSERKVTDSKGYGGPTISYNLCVRTKIGLEKVLIADLPEANQALYLQQALEARLGLETTRIST